MNKFSIINAYNNIKFNVIVTDDIIEFYDSRYNHTEHGQFVTRYFIETIKSIEHNAGLNLYGSEVNWYLTIENVNQIKKYLHSL